MSEKQRSSHALNDLVDIIARAVNPDQIVLFGSQTRGTAHRESDYDFLVVMPDVQNERQISRRIYRALLEQHVGVAVDVVVVDTQKLAHHRDTPGYIYHRALREGEVCYDRARI